MSMSLEAASEQARQMLASGKYWKATATQVDPTDASKGWYVSSAALPQDGSAPMEDLDM